MPDGKKKYKLFLTRKNRKRKKEKMTKEKIKEQMRK